MQAVQIPGRVSRGEILPNGEFMENFAALADGSATTNMAKRFYPEWFKDAILKWESNK